MKRTTIAFDEDLLRAIKAEAARRGATLAQVVNDRLRQSIASAQAGRAYALDLEGWQAELVPGVDLLDRDSLFDRMNGR